jgi:hypothetical protein
VKNIVTLLSLPAYVFGWCFGFVARPWFNGFAKGYMFLELKEETKIVNEIVKEE